MSMRKVIGSALRFVLVFALIASVMLSVVSCGDPDRDYYTASGWNADLDEFNESYVPYYTSLVGKLQREYGLTSAERYVDVFDDNAKVYLYDTDFTICVYFGHTADFGECVMQLFYYGENEGDLESYTAQKKIVELAAEIVHTVCYDTRKNENANYFEKLFGDAKLIEEKEEENKEENTEKPHATYYIFNGAMLEGLGYDVTLKFESDPYFYMMKKDAAMSEETIPANSYLFYGLLKPIEK